MKALRTYEDFISNGYIVSKFHPNFLRQDTSTAKYGSTHFCNDCHVIYPEMYWVTRALWETVVSEEQCILCIPCLEKRLGRLLTIDDFPKNNVMNTLLHFGYALGKNDR